MISATVEEAQVRLVELLEAARNGETVEIRSDLAGGPIVRLEVDRSSATPKGGTRLGLLASPGWELGDAFWDPLPEEELRLWNGEGD